MTEKTSSLRIVFLGTPVFAETSLRALVDSGYNVVAVVTVADKPQGRGQVLAGSPVKEYALSAGIPVLQPTNLKSPDFIAQLKSFQPELGVVVAFRMLPEAVWAMPRLGTINVHGSLLPQYRGAAPINHALIQGEKETGVTIFTLKQEIDTGDILVQKTIRIGPDETAGELHDKMMHIGAEALIQAIYQLSEGNATSVPQEALAVDSELKPAPKIFREHCQIQWNNPSARVHDFIRGLSPHPGAWTLRGGKTLKIFRTRLTDEKCQVSVGTLQTEGKKSLKIACQDGWIEILEVQPEGKKRMTAEEFVRGFRPEQGEVLNNG